MTNGYIDIKNTDMMLNHGLEPRGEPSMRFQMGLSKQSGLAMRR